MAKVRLAKPWIPKDTYKFVDEVLQSGWVASGDEAKTFADQVAKLEGYEYGIATNSCTSALQIALEIMSLEESNTIRIPHITFPATANACIAAGFQPFITDKYFTMGVDLFGLKGSNRSWLIADAACSLGSRPEDITAIKPEISCYSFHARKLITTGEGGAICTDNKRMYERACKLVSHGGNTSYGYNMRMSDINAAVGLRQMDYIDDILDKRHEIAKWYNKGLPSDFRVWGQTKHKVNKHYNYQTFCAIVPEDTFFGVDDQIEALKTRGVECNFGTYRLNEMPYYEDFIDPYAIFWDKRFLALPMYHELTKEDVGYVCEQIKQVCYKLG
jgi:dTDP-4-amino-4,6-dideoxygalactose transaminase